MMTMNEFEFGVAIVNIAFRPASCRAPHVFSNFKFEIADFD